MEKCCRCRGHRQFLHLLLITGLFLITSCMLMMVVLQSEESQSVEAKSRFYVGVPEATKAREGFWNRPWILPMRDTLAIHDDPGLTVNEKNSRLEAPTSNATHSCNIREHQLDETRDASVRNVFKQTPLAALEGDFIADANQIPLRRIETNELVKFSINRDPQLARKEIELRRIQSQNRENINSRHSDRDLNDNSQDDYEYDSENISENKEFNVADFDLPKDLEQDTRNFDTANYTYEIINEDNYVSNRTNRTLINQITNHKYNQTLVEANFASAAQDPDKPRINLDQIAPVDTVQWLHGGVAKATEQFVSAAADKRGGGEHVSHLFHAMAGHSLPGQQTPDSKQNDVLLPHVESPSIRVDQRDVRGNPLVVNAIYWSAEALSTVPIGISDEDVMRFTNAVGHESVIEMQPPTWLRCGRAKNQWIRLSGGQAACARYRLPSTKFAQGEVLCYHLSRYLGLTNVPPAILARVNASSPQWSAVSEQMRQAEWDQQGLIAFIMWIDNITALEVMPSVIYNAHSTNTSVSWKQQELANMTSEGIAEVIQWSDLILFDYITGNYDRVASMQDGAKRENKPSIMREPIRNLRAHRRTRRLWFIDNESGLFDAYQLLYRFNHGHSLDFLQFHREMLHTMCIFNPNTVSAIRTLASLRPPHIELIKYTSKRDPLYMDLPEDESACLFEKFFHTRLKEVVQWIEHCESQYDII